MATPEITRDHITVEHGTGHWGGPTATATVNHPLFAKATFELKSTEGLEPLKGRDKGHGIHVDEEPGRNWLGAFPTLDMNEALDWLVEYLNERVDRYRAEWATMSSLSALNEALGDFGNSLETRTRLEFAEQWERVKDAVAAVDVALASRGDVDLPREGLSC